ncbi:MAG: zinc metalloprotease HtpX [Alphaproteobacteria bacterium]|nr:zinc metalloprotease HtpX [Alphaproteobacteria bacterium]
MGRIKTFVLMLALMLIFMWVGNLIGGESGMRVAFWLAVAMNFLSYFFSDKIVLKQYKAQEVNAANAPELYAIVQKLADRAGLEMPKIYIIPERVPNAFATGRNPSHAAVAVTQGLLELMNRQEIEGVLAHEMSHIKHYDILTSSIAAVFAGAIAMLSNTARYQTSSARNSRQSGLSLIVGTVLMPIAATIIRFSISRTREYAADAGSAELTRHPEWLIAALEKLESYSKKGVMKNATNETAHMFIINPLASTKFASLFSTHPATKDRIKRLENMTREI